MIRVYCMKKYFQFKKQKKKADKCVSISPTHCQFTSVWGIVNTPNFPSSCPCRQPLATIDHKYQRYVRNPDNFSWLEVWWVGFRQTKSQPGKPTVPCSSRFLVYQAAALKKNEICLYLCKEKIIWAVNSAYTFLHNDHWIFRPPVLSMHLFMTLWKPAWACECRYLCCGNSWG